MVKPNSDLINVRLAELERDKSWHELMTKLKFGGIFIPLFLGLFK